MTTLTGNDMTDVEFVKENVLPRPPISTWWLVAGILAVLASLAVVTVIDVTLPEPLKKHSSPTDRFIAEVAYEHLVNLTSIGPRVTGSYENEVASVSLLVAALKNIAKNAAPYHRVEIDLHRANGAFSLTFLDGMNNIYRGVQSVIVRLSARDNKFSRRRSALLLNCHFDTVPDSPGASDDGAGCAVVMETLRALSSEQRPLRHDAIFLLNGAEENIMQASHGFITQHKWAKSVRAFINIEACGAGGREVLFQAGPHDPWIMEIYAGVVPHPFASSLAQELFESGLIPGDTDFRIFRDFGKLSGVDLAWSSNGYVYHTALDTASRVPLAALQRTGDNVLALAKGLLSSERIESEVDNMSRQPVFFDVLGMCVVVARPAAAAAASALALGLVFARLHFSAKRAAKQLYISYGAWWRIVLGTLCRMWAAHAAGTMSSVLISLVLHSTGARLVFYSRLWLLAPLYAIPAVCVTWLTLIRLCDYRAGSAVLIRGWWNARAVSDASALGWSLVLIVCCAWALRSGFMPLLWVAGCSIADLAAVATTPASVKRHNGGWAAWWWVLGGIAPALQTWYMSLNWLHMFVPLTGRAGTSPADIISAVLMSFLVLSASNWLLPFVVATRKPHILIYTSLTVCLAVIILVMTTSLGSPYTPTKPQRFMVFHTRRTVHATGTPSATSTTSASNFYWIPELDVNTPHSVDMYVPDMHLATASSAEECRRWVYCGAPYYLPVASFIARGHSVPARGAPLTTLRANFTMVHSQIGPDLHFYLEGPAHIVMIVSPAEGVSIEHCTAEGAGSLTPLSGPLWGQRHTYFFYLHDTASTEPHMWNVHMQLRHSLVTPPEEWASMSIAGHSLFGESKIHESHAEFLASFPEWTSTTGWGIDLHLFTV